jgi:uncharacterized membrane protein YbhN (UPF0104 family)
MKRTSGQPGFNRSYLLMTGVFLIALYVLLPQLQAFHSSQRLLLHPDTGWAATAIGLTAATYLAAAATYCLLAFKPLAYGATVLVQLAAMFINRLLPGGLGAVGVNYAYLHRRKHTPLQAGSVVAVNNLLGLAGHVLLIGLALAISTSHMPLPAHSKALTSILALLGAALVLVLGLLMIFRRGRLHRAILEVKQNIISYRRRPGRLLAALISSMLLTVGNVLALAACALALGVHLPFVALLIVFTFGIGSATTIPTPGGLGGFEAGLTAGLVAYHVNSPQALAIALLYRLVSYWLPLLAGALAFLLCQKRRLFLR